MYKASTYPAMEGLSRQLAQDCEMSESPTATPFQTRSGSPIHDMNVNHTPAEGDAAMAGMWSIVKSRQSRQSYQINVSSVDGSAAVPTTTKIYYLTIYFAFNLGLTLFNKAVMIQVSSRVETDIPDDFPYIVVSHPTRLCFCLSVQNTPSIRNLQSTTLRAALHYSSRSLNYALPLPTLACWLMSFTSWPLDAPSTAKGAVTLWTTSS